MIRNAILWTTTILAWVWASDMPAAITMDLVAVGNAGNAPDTQVMTTDGTAGYGAVTYGYQIGKFEVTAGQYCQFLNDAAASDTTGLYSSAMWTEKYGCKIEQIGSSGSYTYRVDSGLTDRPVNFVSWYDAARFANWLTTGNTETGVYTFSGPSTVAAVLGHETAAATLGVSTAFFLPTEDEWYKAAYHDATAGTAGKYYDYPTRTDDAPVSESPPGGSNSANYNSSTRGFTDVGAYSGSSSPYGTFDQGGNVREWNETTSGGARGVRGGAFYNDAARLSASGRYAAIRGDEYYGLGFRIASVSAAETVPEPSSLVVWAGVAIIGLYYRPRKTNCAKPARVTP